MLPLWYAYNSLPVVYKQILITDVGPEPSVITSVMYALSEWVGINKRGQS